MKAYEHTRWCRWRQVFISLFALSFALCVFVIIKGHSNELNGSTFKVAATTNHKTLLALPLTQLKESIIHEAQNPTQHSTGVDPHVDSVDSVDTNLVVQKEQVREQSTKAQPQLSSVGAEVDSQATVPQRENPRHEGTSSSTERIGNDTLESYVPDTQTPEQRPMFVPIRHTSENYTVQAQLSDEEINQVIQSDKEMRPRPLANDTKQQSMVWPQDYPTATQSDYMQKCSYYHASEETSIKHEDFESAGDDLWSITPRSNHAIVALVSGDQYARLAVSLVAGLRRVNTCAGIDIVMLLSAGGLGSDECNANKGYTDKQGVVHECGSLHPVHPSQIISTVYITALQRMGVRFQFSPRVEAPTSTLKQTVWWGLAFNKVNVFGMHQYEKVVLLDTDTMVLKNLDYLTFYPMFTASTNQGCCVASEGTHISGGLWVVEPSKAFHHIVKVLINGTDPRLKFQPKKQPWVMTDLDTVNALFTKFKQRTPGFPGSSDRRQDPKGIKDMYTRDAQNWDDEYLRHLRLTTRNDITTMPLQVEDQFWFRASTHDRNEADRIADKLQLPQHRGYVWHALNASYDWQARECISSCAGDRDRGVNHYFSVHFSCLPKGLQKPGRLASYQELQQEINMPTPNLENTTCLLAYYEIWRELYALGMGDDLDKVWYNPAYNGTAKIAAAQTDVDSQRARYEEELDERQARREANRILNEKASNRKKLQFRHQIEMLNEKRAKMPETPSKISLKRKRTRRSDPDENQNMWSWPDTLN